MVRALKEPDWKVCDKVTWGSGMMMNLQFVGRVCVLSYVKAHQRTRTAKEALSNEVDTMSNLVDVDSY